MAKKKLPKIQDELAAFDKWVEENSHMFSGWQVQWDGCKPKSRGPRGLGDVCHCGHIAMEHNNHWVCGDHKGYCRTCYDNVVRAYRAGYCARFKRVPIKELKQFIRTPRSWDFTWK